MKVELLGGPHDGLKTVVLDKNPLDALVFPRMMGTGMGQVRYGPYRKKNDDTMYYVPETLVRRAEQPGG